MKQFVWVCLLWAGVASAQKFVHPGVLVSGDQLNFVKAQVKAHKEPFYGQYQKAMASEYGSLTYKAQGPPATGVIECGPTSRPDYGCHAEDADASAAYLQAVLWWISGDHRYADNAIAIMNVYSRKVTAYTNSNAPLQAAWSAEMWPRAAEIIKYSHAGWKKDDVAAFAEMLTKVNLPLIRNGSPSNGNWELSMIEGMMGIAVFTDDRDLLHHAEEMWKERVPAYFYSDAADHGRYKLSPRSMPKSGWYGQTVFDKSTDGVAQETCRDLGHMGYGISATMAAAETAHIQGDKLYEAEMPRLMAGMEFHAHLFLQKEPVPQTVCGGVIHHGTGYTFVIGYHEFHHRLGKAMPETAEWIRHLDTVEVPVDMHTTVFETLTHAEAR